MVTVHVRKKLLGGKKTRGGGKNGREQAGFCGEV